MVPRLIWSSSQTPYTFEISVEPKQISFALVSVLSMNMIRSCLLQYSYSFKSENNGYSDYMNNTFYGHAPNVNGLLNLDHSDTHVHAKRYKIVMIVPPTCGTAT